MILHGLGSLLPSSLFLVAIAPALLCQGPVFAGLGFLRGVEAVAESSEQDEERHRWRERLLGLGGGSTLRTARDRLLDRPLDGTFGRDWPQDPPPQPSPLPPYVHITSTDVADPNRFWFTDRPTIVGEPARDEWDPTKVINTDRPDFTDVGTVVGRGVTQIETGFLQLRRDDGATRQVTETYPNVLLRVGTSDHFEWRLKWRGFVRKELTDLGTGLSDRADGCGDPEIGFKWILREQDDWCPMHTLVTRCTVPVGSSDITSNRPEPGISYVYNWQIRRWWFLRGATGVDLFNQPQFAFRSTGGGSLVVPTILDVDRDYWLEWSQAFSSYMQVSKRVGIFQEWFMFQRHGSQDDHSDHFHNYGLYFYVTPNVQFDGRIGWRIGDHLDESLYGLGFSVRF